MAISGVIAAGAVVSAIGTEKSAQAAGKAAKAQERAAKTQQEQAIEAAKSPEEFAQLERAAAFQERQLGRQERLIESLDPAILEAATQATQLLRGEEAASLGPARQQRARQREQLLNQLRQQLGPGAETSSVGQQALQNFDQQTSTQLSGLQQQSLSQLFNIGSFESGRGATALAGTLGVARGFGQRAQRQTSAITGTGGAVTGAAGSQFVGEQIRGAGIASIGGAITQGALAGGFGGGGGGAASSGGFTGSLAGQPDVTRVQGIA